MTVSQRIALFVAALLSASPASATLSITVSPLAAPPGETTKVSGTGFGANEAVDIYFDTTDALLVLTDGSGNFANHSLNVSGGALPGQHWISAVERDNGKGVQKVFAVTTAWAEQGFGARGKRYNPHENVLSQNNVNQLDVAWSENLGGFVFGPPAVTNGVAYIGSCDNNLYALDAATGSTKWRVSAGTCPDYSSPAIANGIVYIGSKDSKLYAFTASTGASKWTFNIGIANALSPTVANATVYFGAGYNVYAVNAATGVQKWSAPTDGPVNTAPAAANGRVYATSLGGTVFAFDAATGTQLWSTNVGGGALIEASPAVANNVVYAVANDGKLRAFRARDGVIYWTSPVSNFDALSSPAVANGIVYCGNDGLWQLYAVDAQTGATIWSSTALGGAPGSAPAVANGVAYIGAGDGKLYAFNAANGTQLWNAIVDKPMTAGSPAVSDGMIYVGSSFNSPYDTYLTAFALGAGNDAAYRFRRERAPSYATLHPNFRLRPSDKR